MIKIVLDTNNFISAQISKKGASAQIYQLWKENKIEILTSPFQLKELKKVLNYPRIKQKYRLSQRKIEQIVKIIKKHATILYPIDIPQVISEDPVDNQVLAIAQEGKANFIVSGDHHLLQIKKFKGIPIVSTRSFLKKF